MASGKEIVVKVIADASKYSTGMKDAESKTSSFGSKLHGASTLAAGALGVMGVGLGEFVKKAMDAQTSQAQFDQAVKNSHVGLKQSQEALDAAAGSAAKLGYNEDDVRMAYSKGLVATKDNTQATQDLSTAEDLARYKHISLASAMQMVIKGYQGSSRAAKELGVTVPPATDHAAAATARLKAENISTTSAVGAHIMAQARLQDKLETGKKIMDAVKEKVNGMAASYSGTAQGKLESFRAQWQNLQEELGNVLLPVIERFISILGDVANVLEKHKTIVMIAIGVLGGLAIAIEVVSFATKAWEAIQAVATAAQWAFNAALDANPIGIVVIAIAGLVAALVVLYEKSQTVRDIINEAWTAIKTAATTVFDAIKTYFMVWWDLVKGIFQVAQDLLKGNWHQAWDDMKNAVTNIWNDINTFLHGIPNKILNAIGGLGNLLKQKGDDLMNGLLNGAQNAWNTVSNWVGSIPGKVVSAIGSVGKTLYGVGSSIISGLQNGMESAWNAIKAWLNGIDIGIHTGGIKVAGITVVPAINFDWHPFHLAEGGIVMPRDGGTLAKIGEAGEPEAVVPLSKAHAMGFGGGGGNIELHVHFDGPVIGTGLGQAAKELAEPLRRELLRIQNRNGTLGFA